MIGDLKVTLIQVNLIWESSIENLDNFDDFLEPITKTDIVVLPEMFTTGFSMNVEALAETMDGITVQWMTEKARKLQALICGSIIILENGKYFNRFIAMHPDGHFDCYDKKHLFKFGGEGDHFTAGKDNMIFEYKGWKIKPLICYDLRFPVWARNNTDYDLLIYVANFPKVRRNAWNTLLRARSIENQVYTIGVNRVGTDGNGYLYSGDSAIFDYNGSLLYEKSDDEDVFTTTINYETQVSYRKKYPFLTDRDNFNL